MAGSCSRLKFIVLLCGFLLASKIVTITVFFLVPGLHSDAAEDDGGGGRIVLWTPYFEQDDYSSIGLEEGTFDSCSHKCQFVFANAQDKSKDGAGAPFELRENDAVVFHIRDVTEKTQLPPPSARRPDQLWVFLLQESPHHTGLDLEEYASIFNVTMTYRRDSDIIHPYAKVRRLNSTLTVASRQAKKALTSEHAKKLVWRPNLAAAVVSHCNTHSNRESYISDLQDFMNVHVYGACGPFNCKRGHIKACRSLRCKMEKARICYAQLSQSYKFYLAFENSLCADYVSEKFYYSLLADVVPVVYGGAGDLAAKGLAPPHSYVDARDFGSPTELAAYLHWLDTNHTEYLKYFEWKKNFTVDVAQRDGWCELCGMISEAEVGRPTRTRGGTYEDVYAWWNYAAESKAGLSLQKICEKRPQYKHTGWRDEEYNKLA